MPHLPIPPLTFSRTDKGEEYLPKDQVTRLIDDMQRAHGAALTEALRGPQGEITRLETELKAAKKDAERATGLQSQLDDVTARHDRYQANADLLGITDPETDADLHAIYQSRTAGLEPDKRPAYRAWVEAGLADLETVPALVRSHFEAAVQRRDAATGTETRTTPQGRAPGQGTGQPGGQTVTPPGSRVDTSTGRRPAPTSPSGPVTFDKVKQARPGSPEWRALRDQFRADQGLPPMPKPDGQGQT